MKPNRNVVTTVGGLVGWAMIALAPGLSSAQQPQIRRVDEVPPPASGTNQVQMATGETGGESDLGPIKPLQRKPRPSLLQAYSQSDVLYNSNITLLPKHALDDGLLFQTFGASVTAPSALLGRLKATLYLRHQMVRYFDDDQFDFDAQTVGLSLSYPVKTWFTVYGGFAAFREYDRVHDHEFYKEYDTQFGLWHDQPLNPRLSLYYGYQLDWRPASPSTLTRVENAVYGGLNYTPMPKLTAQMLYRLRVAEYLDADRTDVDHLVSLSVTYSFNRYVAVRGFTSYGDNGSSRSEFNYRVADVGGGLNLTVRF